MKRGLFVMALLLMVLPSVAQVAGPLFDWRAGEVVPDKRFVRLGDFNDKPCSEEPKLYTYQKHEVHAADHASKYTVLLQGATETMPGNGMYDCFSIVDRDGRLLLQRFGEDPLCRVNYLTTAFSDQHSFIQVPLDDDSFALIFAGWVFETEDTAGEMIVVVVNKDKATVVFDAPAFAYKYTASPNFSMEFVDDVKGLIDDSGHQTTTPAKLASRTKYKIWREGNLLKYKSWK